eukprot:1266781-Amphidinium_carterae.1
MMKVFLNAQKGSIHTLWHSMCSRQSSGCRLSELRRIEALLCRCPRSTTQAGMDMHEYTSNQDGCLYY